MNKTSKVIIDADAGADDLLAILMAYLSPNLFIEKIVCSFGNFSLSDSLRKTNFFIGKKVKIVKGEEKPLSCPYSPPEVEIHSNPKDLFSFPEFLEKKPVVGNHSGGITYITLGPLTSLAKLILDKKSRHIDRIFIMGGALFHPGNATDLAEANFYWDPDAVEVVLKSGIPIFLIPLNISDYLFLEPNKITNKKSRDYVENLFKKYNKFYTEDKGFFISPSNKFKKIKYKAGCLHDPLTVAAVIDDRILTFKKIFISTKKTHNSRGFVYPVLRTEHLDDKSYEINVATGVNKNIFWDLMDRLLG